MQAILPGEERQARTVDTAGARGSTSRSRVTARPRPARRGRRAAGQRLCGIVSVQDSAEVISWHTQRNDGRVTRKASVVPTIRRAEGEGVRLYLDSSVLGAVTDPGGERSPVVTRRLLDELRQGTHGAVLSNVVQEELERAPAEIQRAILDEVRAIEFELLTEDAEYSLVRRI